MVALRKRAQAAQVETKAEASPDLTNQSAVPGADAPAAELAAAEATAEHHTAASSTEEAGVAQRLQELRQAEEITRRSLEEQFRQQLAAELRSQPEAPQSKRPKLTERDHAFLGARPGIERSAEFWRVAGSLPHYGSDRFYTALETIFPIEDYRDKDRLPSNHQAATKEPAVPEPQQQPRPERQAAVYAAPVHREGVSYSGRPVQLSGSTVRLSVDERQIARASGMSDIERKTKTGAGTPSPRWPASRRLG